MRFPVLPALGVSAQLVLQSPPSIDSTAMGFTFKEGQDVFTPKDLVELGRPGAGVANNAGDLALISYSQFSFANQTNKRSLVVTSLVEGGPGLFELPIETVGEAFWLSGRTLAHVVENETDKKLDVYVLDVNFQTQPSSSEPTLIGSIPTTTATNFVYNVQSGFLVFSDNVYADGDLNTVKEQDEAWENRGNTGLVYDETYERHWDHWIVPKQASLFSVRLQQDPDRVWHLGTEFNNVLKGTGHSSPVEPFGGTDDFDVSPNHIIYTTKDPQLPVAWHTKQNVYLVDITGSVGPRELTSGTQGATHSPVLNYQGTKAAWLELDLDGYESDRAKIVIYDLKRDVRFTLTQDWDRSPDSIAFSKGGDFIYLTAGDLARVKTYILPIPPTPASSTRHPTLLAKYLTPIPITETGAASGLQPLYYGRLLISKSSLTSPNDVYLVSGLDKLEEALSQDTPNVDFKGYGEVRQVTDFSGKSLSGKGLSKGEDFWFEGAEGVNVHGWILKPKGWKEGEKKKWPVVLLIHGGPQGAWQDQWSTRWNPNVFAQQGYFTVAINPAGSTTFGQAFTDAITKDWGGRPFVDLQKGWKYVLENNPEIDADRAVAAGASWGGYAINWIQGHPEYGFNFKALVAHDGVFDSEYNGYSTDELFFFNHDWGGRPWDPEAKALLDRFNPTSFVANWSTPQLLIHGSKDYRLPETESIGAFHALQQLGIPSRLVIFPDENHWVLKHGNSLKWHYEVFRWFDQFVGENAVATN